MHRSPLAGSLRLLLALAACAAGGVRPVQAQPEPQPAPPPFVQTALALDLAVDYGRPAVTGTATLTLLNTAATPVRELPLLLNRLMAVRSVSDGGGRPLPSRSHVVIFTDDPLRQVNLTTVTLEPALSPGRRVTVRVAYGGPLVGYTETGSLYIRDHIDPEFTILRVDALAFPTVGIASVQANRSIRQELFDFEARVTVPDSEVVATGGTPIDRQVSGSRAVYRFAGKRVPFVNVAIAPYRIVEDAGIRVYALPEDAARAQGVLEAGRQAMARLESWYGPLATPPHVTVIEIPTGFGSQASATAGIILDAAAFQDKAQLPQFYHELSHFWNPPDLDVPSPRWNEGLATYLQFRLAREIDGFAGTTAAVERSRSRACAPPARTELERVPFLRFGVEGKTDYAYRVGFLMFTALEALVGQTALDAGLRDDIQSHLSKGGTTADLTAAIRRAAPTLPDAFFRDWVETSGWVAPVCAAPSLADALDRWRR